MEYKEFDKKYNKRGYAGVIVKCAIIDLNGDIIFQGTPEECNDYHDNHLEVIEYNNIGFPSPKRATINGREVPMPCFGATNIAESIYKSYKQIFD